MNSQANTAFLSTGFTGQSSLTRSTFHARSVACHVARPTVASGSNYIEANAGSWTAQKTSVDSGVAEVVVDGEKKIFARKGENLRFVLQAEKVELYDFKGKVFNCGGYGNCGTCIVNITEGADNTSTKTPVELKKLNKKPETWRLACQTVVTGPMKIQTKPQNKK